MHEASWVVWLCVLTMLAGQGVPEVRFDELGSLSEEKVAEIRRKGCLVIRDVVDDEEARTWQAWLREYVSQNPVDGEAAHTPVTPTMGPL